MVVPSLSTLFPNSAMEYLSDVGPSFEPNAFYQIDMNPTKPQKKNKLNAIDHLSMCETNQT